MAAQRTSFEKLQRDRAKKAKAAAKRERRLERSAEAAEPPNGDGPLDEAAISVPGEELSAAELLARIESIHKQFDAETISYEVFEEKKAELMARLTID